MIEINVYEFFFLCGLCYFGGLLIGMLIEIVRSEDEADQAEEKLKAEKHAVETMHHIDRISGRAI